MVERGEISLADDVPIMHFEDEQVTDARFAADLVELVDHAAGHSSHGGQPVVRENGRR
jgi:hypothetical protein